MNAAATTQYLVSYEVVGTDKPYAGAVIAVAITEGYTNFESIRQILAIKRGLKAENIDIQMLSKIKNS